MTFSCAIRSIDPNAEVELRPDESRLIKRTYLKDEHREKLIHKAYSEIHEHSPDEAPIWDSYQTKVYSPATITVESPAVLVYGFDEHEAKARRAVEDLLAAARDLGEAARQEQDAALKFLNRALFETGNGEVDLAFSQVVTRFNSTLVVRDSDMGGDADKRSSAIYAGDKYFLDPWKRDENISLEGLLACNDFETVRSILASTWEQQDEKTGRLPQILRLNEPVVYFSSDGTLWALRRLAEYTRMSGDRSLLQDKLDMVELFFSRSVASCRRGLLPSGSVMKASFLWETWMDTGYTPREGYPAEIELLWLADLGDFVPWIRRTNENLATRMEECRKQGLETFKCFFQPSYVVDSLDWAFQQRELITPNGFLAPALGYELPSDLAREMVQLGRKHLASRAGVKSLAPSCWPMVFDQAFLDDPANHRNGELASVGIFNYHRGIEWLWLNPFFAEFELQYGDVDEAYRQYIEIQVRAALHKSGVAGLDELEDLHGPLGADFQAWSMAGFITGLKRFAGVCVDALEDSISACPQLPSAWPELKSRHRIGDRTFMVEARRLPANGMAVTISHDQGQPPANQKVGMRLTKPGSIRVLVDGREADAHSLTRDGAGTAHEVQWVALPKQDETTVEFGPTD